MRLHTLRAILLSASALAVLAACGVNALPKLPAGGSAFPDVVDSLLIEPVTPAPGIQINAIDVDMLRQFLREEMEARPHLKTYDKLPTKLANSARVGTRLNVFTVAETPADGIYLRAIDMAVAVSLYEADRKEPFAAFRFYTTYQRAYAAKTDVVALPFDLRNAMKEFAAQIAQRLVPVIDKDAPALPLATADDAGLGKDESHPTLLKGNQAAVARRFDEAITLWSVVLFNPALQTKEGKLFHVSGRVLRVMRKDGMAEDVVTALEPMRSLAPSDLASFKRTLRVTLGEKLAQKSNPELENRILAYADYRTDRIHRNLAAAHNNLVGVYELRRRLDLAAYHLALAHAHNPLPALLERWSALQKARNLIPQGMKNPDALALYQRVPPPANVTVRNGSVDLAVLPAQVAAQPALLPAPAAGAPGGAKAAVAAPASKESGVGVKPVELPPQLPPAKSEELKPVIVVPQS